MTKPALFLDRDGVVNFDRQYVHQKKDVEFIDGIFELVATAKAAGYLVIIITNQAGIGRGYYSEEDFHRLMNWMRSCFQANSGDLDAIYFCPHHPDGKGRYRSESPFRKPAPGMILQAAAELDIDLEASLLIGDKISDIQAGRAAGISNLFLIGSPHNADDFHSMERLTEIIPYLHHSALAIDRHSGVGCR